MEIPLDDVDPDDIGGMDKVLAGGFLFECTGISEGTRGETVVSSEVLSGTTPKQEGKEFKFFLKNVYDKWSLRKLLAFAIATGLVTKQQLDQHKANKTNPEIDFDKAVGRLFCANLENGKGEYANRVQLAWDEFYHPADKRANHIPLMMAKIKAANPPIVLPAGRNPDGISPKPANDVKKPTTKSDPKKEQADIDKLLDGDGA
jgi:hypothetical protein